MCPSFSAIVSAAEMEPRPLALTVRRASLGCFRLAGFSPQAIRSASDARRMAWGTLRGQRRSRSMNFYSTGLVIWSTGRSPNSPVKYAV